MKNIVAFLVALVLFGASCNAEMRLSSDTVTTEDVSYIRFDDMACTNVILRIDYPEYGIGEGQNILLEVNNLPAIVVWHDVNTDYALFNAEYLESAIHAVCSYGGNELFLPESAEGIVDTDENAIMCCAIAGDNIPAGTHVRVWTDDCSEVKP